MTGYNNFIKNDIDNINLLMPVSNLFYFQLSFFCIIIIKKHL